MSQGIGDAGIDFGRVFEPDPADANGFGHCSRAWNYSAETARSPIGKSVIALLATFCCCGSLSAKTQCLESGGHACPKGTNGLVSWMSGIRSNADYG
jgi:hypothetical protein